MSFWLVGFICVLIGVLLFGWGVLVGLASAFNIKRERGEKEINELAKKTYKDLKNLSKGN